MKVNFAYEDFSEVVAVIENAFGVVLHSSPPTSPTGIGTSPESGYIQIRVNPSGTVTSLEIHWSAAVTNPPTDDEVLAVLQKEGFA